MNIDSSNIYSHLSCYSHSLFSDQNLNTWFSSLCVWCVQKVSNKGILLCVSLPRNVANFSFKVSPSHLRGRMERNQKGTFNACYKMKLIFLKYLDHWVKTGLIRYSMNVFQYIFHTWLHNLEKMYTPMEQVLEVKKKKL